MNSSFVNVHINKLTRDTLHGRLVHPNDKDLDTVIEHRIIGGVEGITKSVRGKTKCPDDGCHFGKGNRNNTVKQASEIVPTGPGSHIVADFGGPMPVKSILGEL